MTLIPNKTIQKFDLSRSYQRLLHFIADHWITWAKWGLVAGCLLGAAALGILAGKKNPLYAVIAACLPLIIVGAEFVLRAPQQWPLLILATAAFIPFSLPTGTGSRLVFSLLLTIALVAIWVIRMMLQKRIWIYPSPLNRPLLLFCLVVVIALVWSIIFRDPLVFTSRSFPIVQTASAMVMVMLPGAFLIVANFTESMRSLKMLVAMMLAAGGMGIIGRFLNLPLPINTEGLSAMWFIGLSLSLVYYDRSLSWKIRPLLLGIAAGWVIWGFVLHISWLAGWLPGVLAAGLITWRRSKKLALFIGLIGLVILFSQREYYFGTVLGNEQDESAGTRLAAWEMNWLVTGQHILFGTGPAGYAAYYMSYFPTQAMATHNNYLDIFSQTGIIGLTICLWFFGGLVWTSYKLCARLQGRGDFAEALANAAFAGSVGSAVMMFFGDWLFPFAYTQTIAGFSHAVYCWLFMGAIVALDRLTQPE